MRKRQKKKNLKKLTHHSAHKLVALFVLMYEDQLQQMLMDTMIYGESHMNIEL